MIGLLLVYGVGFDAIGSVPCTLALLLLLMWFVDPVDWWLAVTLPPLPRSACGQRSPSGSKFSSRRAFFAASSGRGQASWISLPASAMASS